MSTLVKLVIAVVLQLLHAGEVPDMVHYDQNKEQVTCKLGQQQLNPHYLITRDELLSHLNERAL